MNRTLITETLTHLQDGFITMEEATNKIEFLIGAERLRCAKYAEDLLTNYIDKPPTPDEVAHALRNGSNPW